MAAPAWRAGYGVVMLLSTKDAAAARALVEADAKKQVVEEKRAVNFTVFGVPGPPTAGNAPPPEALVKNKHASIALFNDKASYHDGEHKERTVEFHKQLMDASLTGDMMADFAGGFMGELVHIDKEPTADAPVYSIYVTAKAKDAAKARELVEVLKAHGSTQLAAEPNALRFAIFHPGGDLPPQYTDDVTVRFVEQWRSLEDYEAHKTTPHLAAAGQRLGELCSDISLVEFPQGMHYAKKP